MFDYALWHGQGAYIERLAREAKFAAALPLTQGGELLGRFDRTWNGWRYVRPSKDGGFADDPKNPMGRATRAVAAMRERLLRPYLERSPKAILQECGLYGVDHRTYCGATPLMLAARAGAVALVEQLLERGADADLVDDYGHTAWMGALNRAIDDHAFGRAHLGALFERLGPDTLDVHADGRLVRLERGQGEFWLLGLMLAGLKTHAGGLFARPLGPQRHMRGFFADSLLRTLELLPEHLWPKVAPQTGLCQQRARAGGDRIGLPAGAQTLETPRDRLLHACARHEVAPQDAGRRNLDAHRRGAEPGRGGGRRRRVVLRRLWPRSGRGDGVPGGSERIGVVLSKRRCEPIVVRQGASTPLWIGRGRNLPGRPQKTAVLLRVFSRSPRDLTSQAAWATVLVLTFFKQL